MSVSSRDHSAKLYHSCIVNQPYHINTCRHRTYNHIPISGTCLIRCGKISAQPYKPYSQTRSCSIAISHPKSSYRTTAPFLFTRIFPVSSIFRSDITIRSVSSHYLTQPTPGTQNTTHQITARHNKKPIGKYKLMDCITHGSSQITSCHCIVYLLLWSALYQQSIPYHYTTFTADTTTHFLLIRHSASITDQKRKP